MKMTFNRKLILSVLAESIEGNPPPHSASSVSYALETAFNYKWTEGLYPCMVTLPNKRQIYRTLKELWHGGLIVGYRIKAEAYNTSLPYWEIEYQLCSEVYRNGLIADCNKLYRKVNTAKNGNKFFTSIFEMGLDPSEVGPLMLKVKSLMQKTHPDKATGFEYQFQQMKKCADWIRSGIPTPTPAHEVNEPVVLKLTYV